MAPIGLLAALLLGAGFGLAAWMEPWFQTWAGNRRGETDFLAVALGDSRRLFAKHVYVKADAYFHNGYYPSIFDENQDGREDHLSERADISQGEGESHEGDFLGEPNDWVDRFSRYFYPSRHTHLGERLSAVPDPDEDHGDHAHHDHAEGEPCEHETETANAGLAREILPWLRFSASLDPHRVETYVVAAFWLRKELNRSREAEEFLRRGLRANPWNQDLLFELGRIFHEDHQDADRARNVWELALKSWREQESGNPNADRFLYAEILGNLAKLEEEQGYYAQAIGHLRDLMTVTPHPDFIRKWIEDLQGKAAVADR